LTLQHRDAFKNADSTDSDKEILVKCREHYGTAYHVKALGAAKVDQLQDAARHNKDVSAFDVSARQKTEQM